MVISSPKIVYFHKRSLLFSMMTLSLFLCGIESKEMKQRKMPKVFLTVSAMLQVPLFQDATMRKVVINYYDAECDRMQRSFPFIALYSHDPEKDIRNPVFTFKPSDCPEGILETDYSFPYIEFSSKDLSSKCLRYWVAYVEAGKIVHSNCIKTHPNWMNNMRKEIGHMTINCLMIPGTHNSGLYFKFNRLKHTIIEKYIYTQEESVFNQLVYGIRFLDIRIWHEGIHIWKSKIQITHDAFHLGLPLLEDILKDVKKFVTGTKEFVIIDFHRLLNGFFMTRTLHKWQHKEIIKLLRHTFGKLIIDYEYSEMQLEVLWRLNKRVLITYRDELDFPEDNYVTYPVYHWWKETTNAKDLHKYLINHACLLPYYCTAAVAVLTPTIWTPIVDSTYSRRGKADEVNLQINKWFRNELSCVNVILTDYFLGNNIIEIAIEINKNKNKCYFFWIYSDFKDAQFYNYSGQTD